MIKKYQLSLLLFSFLFLSQATATSRPCWLEELGEGEDDPLSFQVEFNGDVTPFAEEIQWDRGRFEEYAAKLTPQTAIPVVYKGLHAAYKKATGVDLELRLQTQLSTFLAEKGIDPKDLQSIGGGMQGDLFTHPNLGNSAIKVVATYFDGVKLLVHDADELIMLGTNTETRNAAADLRKLYWRALAQKEKAPAQQKAVYDGFLENIRRIHRSSASQSLHRAYQLMLPGLIAAQAKMDYFDFARVHTIGNGFFIREYYPDSTIVRTGALDEIAKFSKEKGITDDHLETAIQKASEHSPVLEELVLSLVVQSPSYFTSPTLMQSSSERRRFFVIFDLD